MFHLNNIIKILIAIVNGKRDLLVLIPDASRDAYSKGIILAVAAKVHVMQRRVHDNINI